MKGTVHLYFARLQPTSYYTRIIAGRIMAWSRPADALKKVNLAINAWIHSQLVCDHRSDEPK